MPASSSEATATCESRFNVCLCLEKQSPPHENKLGSKIPAEPSNRVIPCHRKFSADVQISSGAHRRRS